ncbi:MAG: hypothetical protein ACFFDT_15235 [Candidatus Hodarchaeota archaeon]
MENKKELSTENHAKKEVVLKFLSPEASQFIIDPRLLKYVKIAKEMVTEHKYDELSDF